MSILSTFSSKKHFNKKMNLIKLLKYWESRHPYTRQNKQHSFSNFTHRNFATILET